MIRIRPAAERGHANHGWLDSKFTFSFADYRDPHHQGFRGLRVINEDVIAPGQGFPTHPHRDMEIITYVLEGAVEHKDSMGNGTLVRPGEVQRMSAGTGIRHSEFNPSSTEPLHLLQIWILPREQGVTPSYAQSEFPLEARRNELIPVVSPGGDGGALTINADATVYASRLDAGRSVTHELAADRHAWVHVARGTVRVGEHLLEAGSGAALSDVAQVTVTAESGDAEILIFDLV